MLLQFKIMVSIVLYCNALKCDLFREQICISASLLQSSVSRDPSEIIQYAYLLWMLEMIVQILFFLESVILFFRILW